MKKIAIFGSTGSIGINSINVIKNNPNLFEVDTLVAKSNHRLLISQAIELKVKNVVIIDEEFYQETKSEINKKLPNCQVLSSFSGLIEVAKIKYDLVISAIVGIAGMIPSITAIQAGSNIAIANKESIVCGAEMFIEEAKKNQVKIIPIDSEHNAIFQIFEKENLDKISSITLTASGGPFFNSNIDFADISVAQALNHPNWQMGKKISIDSATMMNKGLEMIEAFYLFELKQEQINILIHPQSIIHGIVEYSDGSNLAVMSKPDMRIPISYSLNYPIRTAFDQTKLDLTKIAKLEFFPPNDKKFSSINLCKEALRNGHSSVISLNAANEIAVQSFLEGKISFDKIVKIISQVIEKIEAKKITSFAEIIDLDKRAREIADEIVAKNK
jgi:1-deoxy-D-xylulose-5-phosphate reductoisomerase